MFRCIAWWKMERCWRELTTVPDFRREQLAARTRRWWRRCLRRDPKWVWTFFLLKKKVQCSKGHIFLKKGFGTCRFIWVQWFTYSLKEQMIPGLISGGDTKKCLISVQSKWCAKYNCQAHMQPCIIRRFIIWKVKLHKYCLNYTKVIMW